MFWTKKGTFFFEFEKRINTKLIVLPLFVFEYVFNSRDGENKNPHPPSTYKKDNFYFYLCYRTADIKSLDKRKGLLKLDTNY